MLEFFRGRPAAQLQRCPHRPRRHAVDSNALGPKLPGQGLDVVHRRRLGLSVIVQFRGRVIGLLGGGSDDAGTLLHMRQRCLDDVEGRVDVGLHRRIKVLVRDVQNRLMRLLAACVTYHNVEAAQFLHRLLDQPPAEGPVPQVTRDRNSHSAGVLDQLDHFARIRLFGRQIVDGNIRALAGVGNRGCAAHAGVAARDERLAAVQSAGTAVAGFTVIRLWMHFPGQSRPGLVLFFKGWRGIFGHTPKHNKPTPDLPLGEWSNIVWALDDGRDSKKRATGQPRRSNIRFRKIINPLPPASQPCPQHFRDPSSHTDSHSRCSSACRRWRWRTPSPTP